MVARAPTTPAGPTASPGPPLAAATPAASRFGQRKLLWLSGGLGGDEACQKSRRGVRACYRRGGWMAPSTLPSFAIWPYGLGLARNMASAASQCTNYGGLLPLRQRKNRTRCMIAPLRCTIARQCFAAATGGARPVRALRRLSLPLARPAPAWVAPGCSRFAWRMMMQA